MIALRHVASASACVSLFLAACGGGTYTADEIADAGGGQTNPTTPDGSGPRDAGPDATRADASEADASEADASEADASEADASEADASEAGAGDAEAGSFACDDTVKNGDETDIDCGGSCATKCALDRACTIAADCAGVGTTCTGNVCTAPVGVPLLVLTGTTTVVNAVAVPATGTTGQSALTLPAVAPLLAGTRLLHTRPGAWPRDTTSTSPCRPPRSASR